MKQADTSVHRRAAAGLLVLLILATLLRLGFWLEARHLPLYREATGDALTYVRQAEEIARDGVLAPLGEPYSQSPLYPLFLRLVQAAGFGLEGARILQFLLGVIGVWLLWRIGHRAAALPGAVIAALGGAIYGPFLFFEGQLLSISLAVFFLELVLVGWGRPRWAFWTGVGLGLAALAQPNLLLSAAIVVGTALLFPRPLGWPHRRAVAWVLVGLVLLPAATAVRNLSVSGQPVLISTNGGINFFIGNNPQADGAFHLPPDSGLLNRPEGLFTSAREIAQAAENRSLSAVAVDRYWWRQGMDFWLSRPQYAAGVLARKILMVCNNYEFPNHYDYEFFRDRIWLLRFLPTLGWLLPFGAIGLILGWRRGWHIGPVFFLAILVSVVVFFVTGRYRLPLAVLLWPAAGLALGQAFAWRRDHLRLTILAGAAAFYGLLAFLPIVAGGDARAHMLNLEGAALYREGNLEGAATRFRKAVEYAPGDAEALCNLGRVLAGQGKPEQALAYYRQALAADPQQSETYLNLEEMYRQAGRRQEALEILDHLEEARGGKLGDVAAVVAYRRGVNLFGLGDSTAALTQLEKAVREAPTLGSAWLTLSVVERKMNHPRRALLAARKAVALLPESQGPILVLAAAFDASGQPLLAAGAYQKALQIGPKDNEIRFRLGHALLRAGKDKAAEKYLVDANEGKPHPKALWELGQLYERQGRLEEARTAYQALVRIGAPQKSAARARLQALRPPVSHGR